MAQFVMVRTFTSEETDPRWSVRTGLPMQIRMGEEVHQLHLTDAKVERSGFTVFRGTLDKKPVEGFFGIKEPGQIRRVLSGFGMVKILSVMIMLAPMSLLM